MNEFADWIGRLEERLHCLRCDRITAQDVIVCDVCARTGMVRP